jgi:hypothetical protein
MQDVEGIEMGQFTLVFDRPVAAGAGYDPAAKEAVRVFAEGEIPEYAQIWIWDLLYAQQLHALGDHEWARELKEILEVWSVNMSSKVFQPRDLVRLKGHHRICDHLDVQRLPLTGTVQNHQEVAKVDSQSGAAAKESGADVSGLDVSGADVSGADLSGDRVITIRVSQESDGLPSIRVAPEILPASRRFWLVLALAQHFVFENDLFARELPIHVLAFRKFHADVFPHYRPEAVSDAPMFALEKAMAYFTSASESRP